MEKKFERPEAIIVVFNEEDDIITTSGTGLRFGATGDEWQDTDL